MKKIVQKYGVIAGVIIAVLMFASLVITQGKLDFAYSLPIGYLTMLAGFAMVFVGVKKFRDYNGGTLTFGKAFQVGLYISLIASSFYVAAWLVEYYVFIPDFMGQYSSHMLKELHDTGATQKVIDAKTAQMAQYAAMYKNPIFVIFLTYAEILPVGLLVTLIAAVVFKRK